MIFKGALFPVIRNKSRSLSPVSASTSGSSTCLRREGGDYLRKYIVEKRAFRKRNELLFCIYVKLPKNTVTFRYIALCYFVYSDISNEQMFPKIKKKNSNKFFVKFTYFTLIKISKCYSLFKYLYSISIHIL